MSDCVMIFAKAPVLGQCKTRLGLPPKDASALHQLFVQATIRRSRGPWTQIVWSDEPTHPFFRSFSLDVRAQEGESLGHRLAHAFRTSFHEFDRLLVIGTDAPTITDSMINNAFSALCTHDAVIGPSCDGGYYLLGLREPLESAFNETIAWGTETVFVQTLEALRSAARSVHVLPFWFDVDRPQDLKLLRTLDEDSLNTELKASLDRAIRMQEEA